MKISENALKKMPKELLEQLSEKLKTPETSLLFKIKEVFRKYKKTPLDVDRVIIGLYRQFDTVYERDYISEYLRMLYGYAVLNRNIKGEYTVVSYRAKSSSSRKSLIEEAIFNAERTNS